MCRNASEVYRQPLQRGEDLQAHDGAPKGDRLVGGHSRAGSAKNLERALRTEVGAAKTATNEETPQHGVGSAAAIQADDSARTSQWQGDRLVVPTGRGYAKMYESTFWQQWDPLDWCYGDFLYGDPKLDEEPDKQQDYKQYVTQCILREELEYDTYVGENYKAEEYGINHWKHDPDVADLLQPAQRAI